MTFEELVHLTGFAAAAGTAVVALVWWWTRERD